MESLRVHRLLTPTHSSMARCHSAADLHLPCHRCTAPCSPHRSPYRGSPSRVDRRRAGAHGSSGHSAGGSQSTPNTPKKERLRRERRTASPACSSPVKRAESTATITKRSASPATPKLTSKMRAQSPCDVRQLRSSPVRNRTVTKTTDEKKKAESKRVLNGKSEEAKAPNIIDNNLPKTEMIPEKKIAHIRTTEISSKDHTSEKNISNTEAPEKTQCKIETQCKSYKGANAERKDSSEKALDKTHTIPNVEAPEKKILKSTSSELNAGDKSTEPSPLTPTGKPGAGTTNAEEASRLLAERRRQARIQKELEEKQRCEQEKVELKSEQLKKKHAEERLRQEEEVARQVKEKTPKQEEKREEEKRQVETKDKELHVPFDKEREEAEMLPQKIAEQLRQDRELQTLQEEEERQLRKKRIEEIMKRTRKNESEMKMDEGQVETQPVSPPGELEKKTETALVNVQVIQTSDSQFDGKVTVHGNKPDSVLPKQDSTVQLSNPENKEVDGKNTDQKTQPKSGPNKRSDTKQGNESKSAPVNKECTAQVGRQEQKAIVVKGYVVAQQKKHEIVQEKMNNCDHASKTEITKSQDTKQLEGAHVIGQIVNQKTIGSEVTILSKKESIQGKEKPSSQIAELKGREGSKMETTPNSSAPPSVSQRSPPLIKLEPLNGKGTRANDNVQSVEVSPVSKEELISIPEFSPVDVQHNGMSNARALEDLLDLTGHVAYPKLSPVGSLGDCNKNLIEGVCSPSSDSKIIQMPLSSSNKNNNQ
ncbi:MAP7 domain-containing protein 2a [Aplochiton taeniatus]